MHTITTSPLLRDYPVGREIEFVNNAYKKHTVGRGKITTPGRIIEANTLEEAASLMTRFPDDLWEVQITTPDEKGLIQGIKINVFAVKPISNPAAPVEFYYDTVWEGTVCQRITHFQRNNYKQTVTQKNNKCGDRIIFSEPLASKGAHSSDVAAAAAAAAAAAKAYTHHATTDPGQTRRYASKISVAQKFAEAATDALGHTSTTLFDPDATMHGHESAPSAGQAAYSDESDPASPVDRVFTEARGSTQRDSSLAAAAAPSTSLRASRYAHLNHADTSISPFQNILRHGLNCPYIFQGRAIVDISPNPDFLTIIREYFKDRPPHEIVRHLGAVLTAIYARLIVAAANAAAEFISENAGDGADAGQKGRQKSKMAFAKKFAAAATDAFLNLPACSGGKDDTSQANGGNADASPATYSDESAPASPAGETTGKRDSTKRLPPTTALAHRMQLQEDHSTHLESTATSVSPFHSILRHGHNCPYIFQGRVIADINPNPDFLTIIREYFQNRPPHEIVRHLGAELTAIYARLIAGDNS
jgi:hypothetical protein